MQKCVKHYIKTGSACIYICLAIPIPELQKPGLGNFADIIYITNAPPLPTFKSLYPVDFTTHWNKISGDTSYNKTGQNIDKNRNESFADGL